MSNVIQGKFGARVPSDEFHAAIKAQVEKILERWWSDRIERAEQVAFHATEAIKSLEPLLVVDFQPELRIPAGASEAEIAAVVNAYANDVQVQFQSAFQKLAVGAHVAIASAVLQSVTAVVCV